jgi:uncharacterized protein YqeY
MPSALKQKLLSDLKQALKSGEQLRLSVLRMVISGLEYKEIAKRTELADKMQKSGHSELSDAEVKDIAARSEITDEDVLTVLAKEVKQHRESIEAFKSGGRPELAAKEEAELAILQGYMPQQLTRAEITGIVKNVIAETGAQGPRDKGKVMGRLMPQVRGKADGQLVNSVVTELLGG